MKILAIQHSAGDSPAEAGEFVKKLGHDLQILRIDRGDDIPTSAAADALMMFGGATSLTGRELQPWIEPERELIRQYVHEGRRVLGICLGSQILASALGADVHRNLHPEVGWHLVDRVAGHDQDDAPCPFPAQFTALHWHQDTFGIPAGATHILKSDGCDQQGFAIDNRVFGFQFHLEANQRTVEIFLMVSKMHRRPGRFIQSEQQIWLGMKRYLAKQNEILSNFLTSWLS